MKQFKKLLAVFLCAGVLMNLAACGSDGSAKDNGAVNTETTTWNAATRGCISSVTAAV